MVKKNILIIPSWYPSPDDPTAGVFVKKHAIEIAKNYNVTVLYYYFTREKSILFWKSQKTSVGPQFEEDIVAIRDFGFVFRALILFFVSNISVIRKLTSKNKIDFLNLNVVYHIGVFLTPVLLLMKTKLIITEHWTGYFPEDGRYKRLAFLSKGIIKKLFKTAEKVIVISHVLARQLNELFNIAHKTDVVSNSLNVPDKVRILVSNEDKKIEILTISYMDDRMKGISGLIEAMERLVTINNNIHLTIVGGGHDFEMLKAYTDHKQLLNTYIDFTGPVSNDKIPEFYRNASFFVTNSNFETFSVATAEALLYGLPVVASKCRGPEEYVDELVGVLFEKGSVDALVTALEYMINKWKQFDPEQIGQISRKRLVGESPDEQFKKIFN